MPIHQYERTTTHGTQDGKPCIVYRRDGNAKAGEPSFVLYVRKFVSEEKRDAAAIDPNQEVILR